MTNAEDPPDDDAAEPAGGRRDPALRRTLAEIEKHGLVVTSTNNGHYKVTDREGNVVALFSGIRRLAAD